jgi:hypothetical protein
MENTTTTEELAAEIRQARFQERQAAESTAAARLGHVTLDAAHDAVNVAHRLLTQSCPAIYATNENGASLSAKLIELRDEIVAARDRAAAAERS